MSVNSNQETTQQQTRNRFESFEAFQAFIRKAFVQGSGIDPILFDACVTFRQDIEDGGGGEIEAPIHEALGWDYTRFGHRANEPLYAAFLKNEDGSIWQVIVSIWDEDKQRPYKYLAPKGNGDRAFLPPVPPEIRKRIGLRYGIEVPLLGSFWKWVADIDIPRIITEGAKKASCGLSLGYLTIALYGCRCGAKNKDQMEQEVDPYLITDLEQFAAEGSRWLFALDRDESKKAKLSVAAGKKRLRDALSIQQCTIADIKWKEEQGKGLDDLIVGQGSEVFDAAYATAMTSIEKKINHRDRNQKHFDDTEPLPLPPGMNCFDTPYREQHPEALYKPIVNHFKLDINDCVTLQSFDGWAYRRFFGGGEGDWRVIDSAFYQWSDTHKIWRHQTDNIIAARIADLGEKAFRLEYKSQLGWAVRKPYETNGHKESAFKYVRSRLERPEPLPINTHLLSFNNTVVDVRTGETMPHDKNHFLTNSIPYDYEPNKPCPEVFRKFVCDSFGDDMLDVIRAFTSMFLDPTAPYGRFPHLIGTSGGGKGTLGRFWNSLFGEEGSSCGASFSDLATPEGRHQYLTGKRIFGFPDVGGYTAGVRAFYELVDNGQMSGRALFNPIAYSKQWFIRFWLASVDHLQVENAGDGWARRAYQIVALKRLGDPDPFLADKLSGVRADVISWALAMPREERDKILLLPPQSDRAINAALDAALYGDSTKSFVDLCLRPSDEPMSIVTHDQLHTWYVAYCKEHGYTPLGMSKFISHLRTVLPQNYSDRKWSMMINGKRHRVPAHWKNITTVKGVFVSWDGSEKTSGENPLPPQNPIWTCLKARCYEGGLMEFDDFWNPPSFDEGEGGNPDLDTPGEKSGCGVSGVGCRELTPHPTPYPQHPAPNQKIRCGEQGGGNQPISNSDFSMAQNLKSLEPSNGAAVHPVEVVPCHFLTLDTPEPSNGAAVHPGSIVPCKDFGISSEHNFSISQASQENQNYTFSLGVDNADTLDTLENTTVHAESENSLTLDTLDTQTDVPVSEEEALANAQLIVDALHCMDYEVILVLTSKWSPEFKKAVCEFLSPDEIQAIKNLRDLPQSEDETTPKTE